MSSSTRILLCNFVPLACPSCGRAIVISASSLSDFHAGATFQHPCGVLYAYAEERQIVDAADVFGGDMKKQLEG